MSQTISRMYGNYEQASRAVDELKTCPLGDSFEEIFVVGGKSSPPAAQRGESATDVLIATIMKGFVLKSHAAIYAEGIKRGGTLVTVHAPFGAAQTAINIMDSHGPIDSGVPDGNSEPYLWDEKTPMSCLLRAPVLLDEKYWKMPKLAAHSVSLSSVLGLPTIGKSGPSFSSAFGMPLLTKGAASISAALGIPMLVKDKTA
jgi:hypothetical protein